VGYPKRQKAATGRTRARVHGHPLPYAHARHPDSLVMDVCHMGNIFCVFNQSHLTDRRSCRGAVLGGRPLPAFHRVAELKGLAGGRPLPAFHMQAELVRLRLRSEGPTRGAPSMQDKSSSFGWATQGLGGR
jgi:hypothetical protein